MRRANLLQGVTHEESDMTRMILGRKIGMTQIFEEDGRRIPVTVVRVDPNFVLRKKTADSSDGYDAIVLATDPAVRQEKDGQVRYRGLSSAEVGVFEKRGIAPQRVIRELRLKNGAQLANFEEGQALGVDVFQQGDIVDVAGAAKGRGFAGVMKRHNFAGMKMSHGVHESHRGGGSIGSSATPGRTYRGFKMAGQLGNHRVTIQNLRIVRVLTEDNAILIKGAIPGSTNTLVEITNAVKKSR